MKEKRRNRNGFAVLALFALVILFGGCGNSNQKSTLPAESPAAGTATMVGLRTCTGCHTAVTADWMNSRHANAEGGLDSPGYPTLGQISGCAQNCHDPNGDSGSLTPGYTGNVERPVIGCEACHGPGSLHADAGGSGAIARFSGTYTLASYGLGTVSVSGQFMMCTACHQLLDPASGISSTIAVHDQTTTSPTPTGNAYVITDTHFAQPMAYTSSGTATSSPVSGYAMDYSGAQVCTSCHNPHGTADINRDWAASKHANTARNIAPPNQYGPWNHYNWSCDGTDPITCGPTTTAVPPNINDRRYCQRCHTTTGFVAYADALRAGDTTLAGNLHAGLDSRLPFSESWKPEMLECTGCHTDNRGALRNPGAFNAPYDYRVTAVGAPSGAPAVIYASAQHQYPDASASNVCILCHTGRTNGDSIKNLNSAPTMTVDFSNLAFSDAHDFPSAGVMYKGLGYEFAGRNYDNPGSYRHDQIGTSEVPDTGAGGPCVGCHMYRAGMTAGHLFTAVSKSGSEVTNVSSEVCFNCHAGSSTTLAAVVEEESLAFADALAMLVSQMSTTNAVHNRITTARGSSTTNWLSTGDTDVTGNTTGKNNVGAVFNIVSLGNDGGAFVHNSKYVKKLLYDSIDWLDDNQMNYSTGTTLSTGCTITPSVCANAMRYLLPNNVVPFAPSERPY